MKKRAFLAILLVGLVLLSMAQAADEVRLLLPVKWNNRKVDLRWVGSYQSAVQAAGGDKIVFSSDLVWDNEAQARYGYIYAPKTGVLNLRMGPRPKASIVTKAKTNRMVLIFQQGEEWSGVLYDGLVGYVMNSTLKVVDTSVQPRGTATLTWKGKKSGTVYMRMGPGTNHRKVVGLKPGAPVTVFEESGKWTEVEINGWRGYVLTEHLVDFEALTPAEPGDGPEIAPGELYEEILLDD